MAKWRIYFPTVFWFIEGDQIIREKREQRIEEQDDEKLLTFLDIIHHPVFYLKRFGDWILSPSSGKSPLSWAQSIELVHICGPRKNWVGFYMRTETESSLWNVVLNKKQDDE
jgi:hypothetical protein